MVKDLSISVGQTFGLKYHLETQHTVKVLQLQPHDDKQTKLVPDIHLQACHGRLD